MGNTRNENESPEAGVQLLRTWGAWRVVGTLMVVALGAFLLLLGWQYWLFTGGIFKTSNFHPQEWKLLSKKADDFFCYRGGMAHDIKTNILRAGQTTHDVEALLGKPDIIKDSVHQYYLGMCSGLRIDFDSLDIHFNTDGQIEGVYIVQH
ncbi:hypothetical protein [Rhodoferax bucti]|uniref:hypothetical protein n=1 Tax=Rhodoferax bucti TaxID=2576305 RepID=UPI001107FF84|nr:hypothetical protein [Rhodoferax bucti]